MVNIIQNFPQSNHFACYPHILGHRGTVSGPPKQEGPDAYSQQLALQKVV
jgi:hypothetical protein